VKWRRRGGVEEWAGEELYVDAHRAIRFPNHLGYARLGSGPAKTTVRRAFRRFHSDGTVARLEVGFSLPLRTTHTLPAAKFLSLMRELLEMAVRVGDKNLKLLDAGNALAQHYLAATTNRKRMPVIEPRPWWFSAGTPALIFEYNRRWDFIALPPHTQRVLDLEIPGLETTISHAWLQFGKQRCSSWFVGTDLVMRDPSENEARRLRIHLARLHAERECLRLVLFHLSEGDKLGLAGNAERSDAVQHYLNDTLRAIQKPERFGLAQTGLLDAARQAFSLAHEGQGGSLQFMRRQVAAKVENYIKWMQNTATTVNNIQGNLMSTTIQLGNVVVTGDFNVVTAANLQNSFNKAANADVNDELKEKLKSAAVIVGKLAEKLAPDDAEELSKNLNILTSEAASKKPRKEWYELSAKGILEAAKTVAELAAPVTAAVQAVLALLVR
jgi:hypothetical protein